MLTSKKNRNYIRDFPCQHYKKDLYVNSEGVFDETDLDFPRVYKTAEGMVQVGKEIARANGLTMVLLPFCFTIELEGYGGDINYGDEKVGPRPGRYVLEDPRDLVKLKEPDLNKGRMGQLIKAVELLKEENIPVAVTSSGPFLTMSGMMDMVPILKAIRKKKPYILEVFDKYRAFELSYYQALAGAGADIISMTELSMANIFGPEISETLVKYYLYPFFKEAEEKVDTCLHICPKSSYAIVDTGYGSFENIRLDPSLLYGQAMVQAYRQDRKIFGARCIANIKTQIGPKGLNSIKLK